MNRNDPGWDKFHESGMADWKRARALIEHENDLTDHRQTWLMNSQAFLFAGFALVVSAASNKESIHYFMLPFCLLLVAISIVGCMICIFIGRSIEEAEIRHQYIKDWWQRKYGNDDPDELTHPKIAGDVHRWFAPSKLSTLFAIVWGILFLSTILFYRHFRHWK
jgi:hypothetical protein